MAGVVLKKVSKIFDNGFIAVKNIDLEIPDKKFTVLVGPSGCGKTTTLRMIAGLEDVSEGDILIGDKVVNEISPKDRDIAMVFQNYALYPHMTVFQNMAFGLQLRKFSKKEIEQRVNEAAEILELTELLDRKPNMLSGGQKQRVAVGRAIVRKPQVFLFDEPLSNLDAKLRMQMRTEIQKIQNKLQTTMIYVTHDQMEAMTMGDVIVIMNKGEIIQRSDPITMYDRPSNKFVAGFIGAPSMNFVSGKGINDNDSINFVADSIKFNVHPDHHEHLKKFGKSNMILGFRPEHVLIPDKDQDIFTAVVEVIEPMGSEIYIYFKVDEINFTGRFSPDIKVRVGDEIKLTLYKEKIHFFAEENGDCIV